MLYKIAAHTAIHLTVNFNKERYSLVFFAFGFAAEMEKSKRRKKQSVWFGFVETRKKIR